MAFGLKFRTKFYNQSFYGGCDEEEKGCCSKLLLKKKHIPGI